MAGIIDFDAAKYSRSPAFLSYNRRHSHIIRAYGLAAALDHGGADLAQVCAVIDVAIRSFGGDPDAKIKGRSHFRCAMEALQVAEDESAAECPNQRHIVAALVAAKHALAPA